MMVSLLVLLPGDSIGGSVLTLIGAACRLSALFWPDMVAWRNSPIAAIFIVLSCCCMVASRD